MTTVIEPSQSSRALLPDNPFCTSRVRPGAIAYRFARGDSAEALLARWEANGRRGAIVGTHGSGKSTLLKSMLPIFQAAGYQVQFFQLSAERRRLPISITARFAASRRFVLIIDGFEQAPYWRRLWIRAQCRAFGIGLLVTAHRPMGLPTLTDNYCDDRLACALASELMAGYPPIIQPPDVIAAWNRAGGNVRETFFALYDLFESRKPTPAPGATCGL